jgi:hypothetical protein
MPGIPKCPFSEWRLALELRGVFFSGEVKPEASDVTARGQSIGVPQGRVPRIITDQYACRREGGCAVQYIAVACLLYNNIAFVQ